MGITPKLPQNAKSGKNDKEMRPAPFGLTGTSLQKADGSISIRGRCRFCCIAMELAGSHGSGKLRPHYDRVSAVALGRRIPHVYLMKQSDIFRENAENCLQLAERADGKPAFKRFLRMAEAWRALATEQDWLDGEVPPTVSLRRRT